MIFGNTKGRRKKNEDKGYWKGFALVRVNKFKYLGFTLSSNNENKLLKDKKILLKGVWSK